MYMANKKFYYIFFNYQNILCKKKILFYLKYVKKNVKNIKYEKIS